MPLTFPFLPSPRKKTPCNWLRLPILNDELLIWLPEKHPETENDTFPVHHLAKYPFIITQFEHDTDIDRLPKIHHVYQARLCSAVR